MHVKWFVVLVVGLAVTLGGPVFANTFRYSAAAVTGPKVAAGFILADGRVSLGQGFAVRHPRAGEYDITFTKGFFAGCAAMVVNSAAHNAVAVVFPRVCHPAANYTVELLRNGSAEGVDSAFQFVAVEEAGTY